MINPLSIPSFLTGVVFVIAGVVMLKRPPKEINSLYGYRTPNSMKDQESWNYAQAYSAKEMIRLGIFLTLVSSMGIWYKPGIGVSAILTFALLTCTILLLFIRVERAINRNRKMKKRLTGKVDNEF